MLKVTGTDRAAGLTLGVPAALPPG
jgi:hypothetical protein